VHRPVEQAQSSLLLEKLLGTVWLSLGAQAYFHRIRFAVLFRTVLYSPALSAGGHLPHYGHHRLNLIHRRRYRLDFFLLLLLWDPKRVDVVRAMRCENGMKAVEKRELFLEMQALGYSLGGHLDCLQTPECDHCQLPPSQAFGVRPQSLNVAID